MLWIKVSLLLTLGCSFAETITEINVKGNIEYTQRFSSGTKLTRHRFPDHHSPAQEEKKAAVIITMSCQETCLKSINHSAVP